MGDADNGLPAPESDMSDDYFADADSGLDTSPPTAGRGDTGADGANKVPRGEADHPGMDDHFEDIAKYNVLEVTGDDSVGRKLIVFYCCRLPPSNTYNQERLLGFLKFTLDQYVESDYSLVVFFYGLTRENRPTFKWLMQAYRELERKYKKNLKALYIVHPSNFVKIFWKFFFKHLVSQKFRQKLLYIQFLEELKKELGTDRIEIPQMVKEHDEREIQRKKPNLESTSTFYASSAPSRPTQQFGVSLDFMKDNNNGDPIPRVVRETVDYLSKHALEKEGIFRRCPKAEAVKQVQEVYNSGQPIDYSVYADSFIHAVILKTFFRELPEPIMTYNLYDIIINMQELKEEDDRVRACQELVCNKLPADNYLVLRHVMKLLYKISEKSEVNMMTAQNLAIVFGPNLVWSRDTTALHTLHSLGSVNAFAATLISGFKEIFTRSDLQEPVGREDEPSREPVGESGDMEGKVDSIEDQLQDDKKRTSGGVEDGVSPEKVELTDGNNEI